MKFSVNKQRNLWWSISLALILGSLIAMLVSWQQINAPLRPSLDFIGGTRLQLQRDCNIAGVCDRKIDLAVVRQIMADQGLGNSTIQLVDKERNSNDQILSIRTKNLNGEERTKLQDTLGQAIGKLDLEKSQNDTVGPTIGRQLLSSGLLALIVSFAGIIIYLSFRFEFDYALFAIVALFHDVLITTGAFSVLGLVQGVEVDSLFIVSLLTITGFSVNDTVVIYDRIREVIKLNPDQPIKEIVDDAVNQTLTRSINTTLTVLLTLFSIFFFGGETLKNFALALIIGFTLGAYSSIFIASTLLSLWRESRVQPKSVEVLE
jgi:preprotein translocase subunit SecF